MQSNNSEPKQAMLMEQYLSQRKVNESSQQDAESLEQQEKKVFIGPKNNQIDFCRIIHGHERGDAEILGLTTLMIKNIPTKV